MVYRLQELRNSSYSDFSEEYVTFRVEAIEELPKNLVAELSLFPTYKEIQVPRVISNLINGFCNTHPLEISVGKIISLIGGAQKLYMGHQEIDNVNQDVKDYFDEVVELRKLLKLIKEYKFNRENLDLKSVRFVKSENKTIETFKNTWIQHKIVEGLIHTMNLDAQTPEEFELQAEAEISKFNLAKLNYLEYYIKGIALKAFRHYLNDVQEVSDRYRNNCAGVFLNCAQIPLTPQPIILSPIFTDNLSETDPTHIYQLLTRLPKSFI